VQQFARLDVGNAGQMELSLQLRRGLQSESIGRHVAADMIFRLTLHREKVEEELGYVCILAKHSVGN
jgi:hypothetical protein